MLAERCHPCGVTDTETYRARACDLRARARSCETAAEASSYVELAAAWEKLAEETEALIMAERARER